jgi:nitroimidazol reductase NimA-like FMN-containing flavoprotein (pyridoxamine 5'-phosphate oxidase superfamily)
LKIVKLPKMTKREIDELIEQQILCRIAFRGSDYPYIAPFQYVRFNGNLYFHFTNYGKKMRLLEKDKRVCVEIEKYLPDLSEYQFVILQGRLNVVTESKERENVIRMMAKAGEEELSSNFLSVHGFSREDGWSALSPEKPLVVVKLDHVTTELGLRSPKQDKKC